ncbi:MAG: glutaminase A [Mucinivorans sp.]
MKTIRLDDLHSVVNEAHDKFKGLDTGHNANYIPYLASVDSSLFGIAVALPSGDVIQVGHTDYVFGIESISKVPNAILAMEQHSVAAVLDQIGADATGLPFNSIMAILMENDSPSTPLVNAGAIAAASMVKPTGKSDEKWKAMADNMAAMGGGALALIDELYKSESDTNFNNRSIAWLLRNYGKIYDDVDLSLDLYTRGCSMGVTTSQLAIMGATIAGGGVNPVSGVRVFRAEIAPRIISLIATVGFYQNTGRWLFTSGIPAKTGVGGGVLGVVPSTATRGFGIAAFSPPLDKAGNSVRAQKAIEYITNKLSINVFDCDPIYFEK